MGSKFVTMVLKKNREKKNILPVGWSQAFMAIPLTDGLTPLHLLAPALPVFVSLCYKLEKFNMHV
jgi:hypothetical protein